MSKKVKRDPQGGAYPFLIDNVDGATLGGAGPSSDLGAQASNAISKVLTWRGSASDPAGFEAALKASFTLTESEGHVVATYTPRAASIQADLGALTGAQASLFARAKSTQDLVEPLIVGLTVLDPAADLEDVEALRRLTRDSILELVAEVGTAGGPRIARVDTLFSILMGPRLPGGGSFTTETVGGQLGQLRDRFGLIRGNVNGLDDEAVLTSMYTVVDSLVSLNKSWASQKSLFRLTPGVDGFLGPEVTQLSWLLAAALEQLNEVRFLLRSVFVGEAEQQATEVVGKGRFRGQSMPLSDLLSWLEDFLMVRGPRLVAENGRDGIVDAFAPMAKTLWQLSRGLTSPQPTWPGGMKTDRVQNGFSALVDCLNSIHVRVGPITRTGVSVKSATAVQLAGAKGGKREYQLDIVGTGLLPEYVIELRDKAQRFYATSETFTEVKGQATIEASAYLTPGSTLTVVVTDAAGRQQASWKPLVLP